MNQNNIQILRENDLQEIKGGCSTCGKTLSDRFTTLLKTMNVTVKNANCTTPIPPLVKLQNTSTIWLWKKP